MLSPFHTASLLVQSLYKQGVRHAILSPGSRSTPLALAFAHHDGFSKKVVLDERSAAFIALGIGKESGMPAVLVCTSGTAAVNYFPAIVEARQSGTPIIALTADRPPALRGTGSSQTIDQIKLYGDYAVFFHEAGEPADEERDRARIKFAAKQAVTESIRKGGAAHLNLPFRKPLEPSPDMIERVRKQNQHQITNTSEPKPSGIRTISLSDEIIGQINQSSRPLIIAGPANYNHTNESTALEIAEKLNAPVIAEPGSRFGHHNLRVHRFEQFLRTDSVRNVLTPDLILRFGDQPFTRSLLTAIKSWREVPAIHFNGRASWQDHEMSADWIIDLVQNDRLETDLINPQKSDYFDQWSQADSDSELKLNIALEDENTLCDGHIFHHISNKLPDDWNLMLSNSFPVRDAALFGNPAKHTIVNRGAAGIDGIISTAIGSSLATDSPTCCLAGDLAFLYDSNALFSLKHLSSPFVIVVINNNGGNIFRMLPIYEHQDTYQTYFETPQKADFEHIAKAYGVEYRRIESKEQLDQINFQNTEPSKPLLIECVTHSDKSMAIRKTLWAG